MSKPRASARGDGRFEALEDDPSAFLTAAGKVQAAADWLLEEVVVRGDDRRSRGVEDPFTMFLHRA